VRVLALLGARLGGRIERDCVCDRSEGNPAAGPRRVERLRDRRGGKPRETLLALSSFSRDAGDFDEGPYRRRKRFPIPDEGSPEIALSTDDLAATTLREIKASSGSA
jgi:hypothetical protein